MKQKCNSCGFIVNLLPENLDCPVTNCKGKLVPIKRKIKKSQKDIIPDYEDWTDIYSEQYDGEI